jgi:hypothetical protein
MAARLLFLVLTAAGTAALCVPLRLPACAVAMRRGDRVEIADETALILWDPVDKVQHFIRRASFRGDAGGKDFGFLVPVPSYPTLAEAGDEAFGTLERVTAPRTVTKRREVEIIPFGCPGRKMAGRSVQVLQEKRVAGYDAVVLEARKGDALGKWLRERGYDFAEELKGWADDYIARGWKFAAFKVGRDEKGEPLPTSAVRLTFATDRPFFPYREPARQASPGGRSLRVYLVAEARYKGALKGPAWPGHAVWSNRVDEEGRAKVLGQLKLPADTGPREWWLTEFEDRSSPRPGHDDVYFERDESQEAVERRPNVVYTEPWLVDYLLAGLWQLSCCWVPFVLLVVVWWWWRRLPPRPGSPSGPSAAG